jgi:hypothetical protein
VDAAQHDRPAHPVAASDSTLEPIGAAAMAPKDALPPQAS